MQVRVGLQHRCNDCMLDEAGVACCSYGIATPHFEKVPQVLECTGDVLVFSLS